MTARHYMALSDGGAKPIIMPVGESTRQVTVDAMTQELTLDITIDDFEEHEACLLQF